MYVENVAGRSFSMEQHDVSLVQHSELSLILRSSKIKLSRQLFRALNIVYDPQQKELTHCCLVPLRRQRQEK